MREKRALLKSALRRCENNEQTMRTEHLTSKFCSGNAVSFWSEAKNLSGSARMLPLNVDHVTGDTSISELWKENILPCLIVLTIGLIGRVYG